MDQHLGSRSNWKSTWVYIPGYPSELQEGLTCFLGPGDGLSVPSSHLTLLRATKPYSWFHGCVHLLMTSSAFQPSVFGSWLHKQNLFSPRNNILLVPCLVQFFKARATIGLDVESVVKPRAMPNDPRPSGLLRSQRTLQVQLSMNLERTC